MRKILKLLVIVILTTVLFGCNAAPAAESTLQEEPELTAIEIVYGKIKEINGNEILLVIGTMGGADTERPARGDGEAPAFGGERTARGDGEAPAFGSERPVRGDIQTGSTLQVALRLTDEEKLYQIPVTAKITAGTGAGAAELRFTQLAVKNVVSLRIGENGEIIAVQLLQ